MAVVTNSIKRLTKTDFLVFLQCPNNFWLMKNDPESYISRLDTEFEKTKMKEGNEVEQLARSLFLDGVLVSGRLDEQWKKTKELIIKKKSPIFQSTFLTGSSKSSKDF